MGEFVIRMPDVGEGVAEAELVEWHVKPGDQVREDMVLAAVMTDKATVEIPSPVNGTVLWLGASVGDTVAVKAPLLRIAVEGEGHAPAAEPATDTAVEAGTPAIPPADIADIIPLERAAVTPRPEQSAPRPPVPRRETPEPPAVRPEPGEKPLASPAVRLRAQEAGIDLRLITSAMKFNADLERVGDQAVNIAESVLVLLPHPPVKPLIDIPRMAEISEKMVKDALDAFVKRDAKLARDVLRRDDEVDELKDQVFRELLTYMMADPGTIQRALALILISRNLERIADHATNIAEDVIFIAEAKDVRHHAEETSR